MTTKTNKITKLLIVYLLLTKISTHQLSTKEKKTKIVNKNNQQKLLQITFSDHISKFIYNNPSDPQDHRSLLNLENLPNILRQNEEKSRETGSIKVFQLDLSADYPEPSQHLDIVSINFLDKFF